MEKAGLGSKSSDHTADLMMLIKGKEEAAGWTRTSLRPLCSLTKPWSSGTLEQLLSTRGVPCWAEMAMLIPYWFSDWLGAISEVHDLVSKSEVDSKSANSWSTP